jgi:hypothetical protein
MKNTGGPDAREKWWMLNCCAQKGPANPPNRNLYANASIFASQPGLVLLIELSGFVA